MEPTEIKWRRERLELYEKLECSAENGLDREAVLASRELFDFDASGQAIPKEFTFQHDDDAVTVVCAEIPQAAAQQWGKLRGSTGGSARRSYREQRHGADSSGDEFKDVYVGDQSIMHVTLFYTSHPDDLAPRRANEHKSERLAREISLLREMATQFEPIHMVPVNVVLASSGAIMVLFQCVQGEGNQTEQKVKNAASDAEFGVDLLRQAAQKTFPFVSKKSPNSIIHTTLVRLMSPDAFDEAALTRVREACQRISQQLTILPPPSSWTSSVFNKMSSSECSEQEAQWRQQRAGLYEELYEAGKKALNREGTELHARPDARVQAVRVPHGERWRGAHLLPHPHRDGGALPCCRQGADGSAAARARDRQRRGLRDAPRAHARHAVPHVAPGRSGPEREAALPPGRGTAEDNVYAHRAVPNGAYEGAHDLFGRIIMLFQCLPAIEILSDDVVNAHAEFSVDHIRRVAKETFSYAPKTDTRVIIHSTLGRVLSPDIHDADLDRLRARCDEITAELAADPQPALFDKLWFVEETHNLSPQGPKTEIPLLGGV
ncbi:hypothetical protein GQ600_11015 [Phytophthora cactorum]|nr:hypothetical protein GQ600_11015 [Phytophthora cactorum]